ncbi:rRNA adenine N-6-methyltransferase [Candidatus Vidania fulgoroideae]|nr:rRNA adenine N-6-methyltransferase [Candidatus Vidania fulgoroideae]
MRSDKVFLKNKEKINNIFKKIKSGSLAIEIGPGLGNITKKIVKKFKKTILIEKEEKFCTLLKKKYKKSKIVNKDFLKYKIRKKSTIIGNIPYSISKSILNKLIKEKKKIKKAYIMLQKELFEAIINAKNTHSFLILLNFRIKNIEHFSGEDFYPQVKVKSVFFKMKPIKNNFSKKLNNFINKNYYSFITKKKNNKSVFFKNFKNKKKNIRVNENLFFLLFYYKMTLN